MSPPRSSDGLSVLPFSRQRRSPEEVRASRLLANLLTFGRDLRRAGMPVGSGQLMSLVEATSEIDCRRREDFYHASRATLVNSPEQIPVFDAAFAHFWRNLQRPTPEEEQSADSLPEQPNMADMLAPDQPKEGNKTPGAPGEAASERMILAVEEAEGNEEGESEEHDVPPEDVLVFSAREVLRKKDFAHFSPEEIAEARRIIESMSWRLGTRKTRRREKSNLGEFIDYRATLRRSMRHAGVPLELRRRRRKERMRPLVLICDISGSMDRYSRLLLRFVHALELGLESVEVFVFSTRLTRITRELHRRDVDDAIADVVKSVDDWSGGTRIGEAIKTFNYKWARRVLRSGATVVMISDGWDRGEPALLASEMARLQRSCRRLIWLNPLLGAPGYQPLTQGIRAALPFVDAFLPIHNLQSLEALADLLSDMADQPPVRAHASVSGPGREPRLPSRPVVGNRGELLVKVGPMVSGRPRPRSHGE
ncbi:MAG: vWA domain-containing protein [Thermomicrobiales bacterium]